jgi:flagellar biogenesis protein FliO
MGGAAAVCIGMLLFLCAPSVAFAETFERDQTPLPESVTGVSDDGESDEGASDSGATGGIVRMIVGLAIVIAVIYGVYWLLRAHARSKTARVDGGIGVIASAALAPNRAVHLLQVGDELVLVGTGEQSVTPLRVYSPDEAIHLGLTASADEQLLGPTGSLPVKSPRAGGILEELRRRTTR